MSQPAPLQEGLPPALQGVPLTLTVRVGTATRTVKDLMRLREGTLVTLNSRIDEPVEICVEDRVIARGQLVEAENGDGLAVRLTELVGADLK